MYPSQRRSRDSKGKKYLCPQPGCGKAFFHLPNLCRHQRQANHGRGYKIQDSSSSSSPNHQQTNPSFQFAPNKHQSSSPVFPTQSMLSNAAVGAFYASQGPVFPQREQREGQDSEENQSNSGLGSRSVVKSENMEDDDISESSWKEK